MTARYKIAQGSTVNLLLYPFILPEIGEGDWSAIAEVRDRSDAILASSRAGTISVSYQAPVVGSSFSGFLLGATWEETLTWPVGVHRCDLLLTSPSATRYYTQPFEIEVCDVVTGATGAT